MEENRNKNSFERARSLLNGIFDSNISSELKSELRGWFKSDVSEDEKYSALERMFEQLQENKTPDESDYARLHNAQRSLGFPTGRKRVSLRHSIVFRLAAVLIPAVLIIGGAMLWLRSGADDVEDPLMAYVTVESGVESQKYITLPDSSQVWLNESSRIRYGEGFMSDRVVELEGEAYFAVRRSNGAKFTVKAGELTTTVLGTEFNVRAYSGEELAEVRLESGSVAVAVGADTYVMKPNEKLVVDRRSLRADLETNLSTEEQWRSGMEFDGESLNEIFSDIAQRFNVELVIIGELPYDEIRFGFDYNASLESILSVLKAAHGNFTYQIRDGKLTVIAI